ncbi:MAG: DUF3617 family protein [Hyphomicrobium sp.]
MPMALPRRVLLAALLLLYPAVASAEPAALPVRKAGKWELTTKLDEGKGPREQVLVMCVDGDMERNTAAASVREHQSACSRYDIVKSSAQTVVDAECVYASDRVTSRTEMNGDFETTFDVRITSKTVTSTPNGQSMVRNRTITQSGKRLGDSCGDLAPGEAMGADGKKVIVQ